MDPIRELLLGFRAVGPRDQTAIVRLSRQCLRLLSYLVSPRTGSVVFPNLRSHFRKLRRGTASSLPALESVSAVRSGAGRPLTRSLQWIT